MSHTHAHKSYDNRLKAVHEKDCGENHDIKECPVFHNFFEAADGLWGYRSLKAEYRYLYNYKNCSRPSGFRTYCKEFYKSLRAKSRVKLRTTDHANDEYMENTNPRGEGEWNYY